MRDKKPGSKADRAQKVASKFSSLARAFLDGQGTAKQRSEIWRCYAYEAGHQWHGEEKQKRLDLQRPMPVVDLSSPMIRAVSGHEIMNRKKITYQPRKIDLSDDSVDQLQDAADGVADQAGYESERMRASYDRDLCGIGATISYLDFSDKKRPGGREQVDRIFPGYLFYDSSVRGGNINRKATWAAFAEPVNAEWLEEYIEHADNKIHVGGVGGLKEDVLNYFGVQEMDGVGVVYTYQWYEMDAVWDVINPFKGGPLAEAVLDDPELINVVGQLAQKMQLDLSQQIFTLDAESRREFKDTLEVLAELLKVTPVKLEESKRYGRCYYQAEFAGEYCTKLERLFTQECFTINFLTAYYDEVMGAYYGLMRPLSQVQDLLNMSMSDYQTYLNESPKGGHIAELGAIPDLATFKKTRSNEREITLVGEEALQKGMIQPKVSLNAPGGIIEYIRLTMELLPKVIGLGPEFFGILSTGDMGSGLYGQVVRQSYAVLAHIMNGDTHYLHPQGLIFEAMVRMKASINDGEMIRRVNAEDGDKYIRLTQEGLAHSYDVIVTERPLTMDEKQESIKALIELIPMMQQAGVPTQGVVQAVVTNMTLDQEEKRKILESIKPAPAQPDPMNQQLLSAQVALTAAQARDLNASAMEKEKTLGLLDDEMRSVIAKNVAQAQKAAQPTAPRPIMLNNR